VTDRGAQARRDQEAGAPAAPTGGSFTRSADSGATWSPAQAGMYAFVGAGDGNPHVVYAASAYPQIVRKSSDRGQTWADSLTNANPQNEVARS
jgi:hypothetical protein